MTHAYSSPIRWWKEKPHSFIKFGSSGFKSTKTLRVKRMQLDSGAHHWPGISMQLPNFDVRTLVEYKYLPLLSMLRTKMWLFYLQLTKRKTGLVVLSSSSPLEIPHLCFFISLLFHHFSTSLFSYSSTERSICSLLLMGDVLFPC